MVAIWAERSPGVYREDRFLKPEPALPTGVAGFVGFAEPVKPAKPDEQDQRPVKPYTPVALHHREDFAWYFDVDKKGGAHEQGYLKHAVNGFFANGGTRCYVAYAEPAFDSAPAKEALLRAVEALAPPCDLCDLDVSRSMRACAMACCVEALAPLCDLDVIAVPDAVTLGDAMAELQGWLLKHCAGQGDRFAILDVPQDVFFNVPRDGLSTKACRYRNDLLTAEVLPVAMSGSLYYPWIQDSSSDKAVPPCGHIAGIFARSDARIGVFKAPANEEVIGALDLATEVSNDLQEALNPQGINCLRTLPGRGIRVFGARTLCTAPAWRYINVRRLFITVRRWIEANMGWAVFEPSTPALWSRIRRELGGYLHGLWRLGGLQGRTAEQAFYVKCDAETNPPGAPTERVVTEIGLAPIAPAEFVVVRIVHRTPLVTSIGGE